MSNQATMTESTGPPTSTAPAPGWYQDPNGSGLRWWDGSTWTEHTHEAEPANPAPTSTAVHSPEPVQAPPRAEIATTQKASPAKAPSSKVSSGSFINDHSTAILIVLFAALAVVAYLQLA